MLHSIQGTINPNRVADIVFVHGLAPLGRLNHAHAFQTWGGENAESDFWPLWLAEDLQRLDLPVGIRILEYEASALGWLGDAMPLSNRATNVLNSMFAAGLDDVPIVFIAHSLGGLVVKQILQRSEIMGIPEENFAAQKTVATVLLATPNSGADMATFFVRLGKILRQTAALRDLVRNGPQLMELATWYRSSSLRLGIATRAHFETKKTSGLLVVDQASADPGIPGAAVVPSSADHSDIARIRSRKDPDYQGILRFLQDKLNPKALYGVTIDLPIDGATVGERTDVSGKFRHAPSNGYRLVVLRLNDEGHFAPAGEATIDYQTKRWNVGNCFVSRNVGDEKRLAAYLIKEGGLALLDYFRLASEEHNTTLRTLSERTGLTAKFLPMIRTFTPDMECLSIVHVKRGDNR